jgi:peptidoglycan/xylan/chitin deacetylase (PgdA/CDA1 family)
MIKNYLRELYILKPISHFVSLISSPWKGKGAILMYHRVLPDEEINEDYEIGLAVTKSNFEKQIKTLSSNYKIVSMDEFVNNLDKKDSEFMVSVTFDDGYKDNLLHALPVLENYKIPATIYIATRFLENHVTMWWYELKSIIEQKSVLEFEYQNKNFFYELNDFKQKKSTFEKIRKIFLYLTSKQQLELLNIISKNNNRKNFSNICLNKEELKVLDKNPLITIGSHTHNHVNLKMLSEEEILKEIKTSLEILKDLLGHDISHFSYPYGDKNQASDREYEIIKKLNFNSALTTRVYPIRKKNIFSLPRLYVGGKTCDKTLKNHLSGFYNLASKFI